MVIAEQKFQSYCRANQALKLEILCARENSNKHL